LNKDGLITQMRITEAGGEWIEDENHDGLLRKAEVSKGELGVYRLVREGFDNDGDDKLNEDEPGGVNINKNFTYNYKYFEIGSGPHQISEVETRALVDFAFAHSNIAAVFSFSPNDNLITPWEPSKKPDTKEKRRRSRKPLTSVEKVDAPYFDYISDAYKKISGLKDLPVVKAESGALNEWAYYHYGRWSFSTLAWIPPIVISKTDSSASAKDSVHNKKSGDTPKSFPNDKKTYEERLWGWLKSSGQESGFVEWKEIKHPDYPDKKVEVGGFNPSVFSNPPRDSLASVSHNFQTFMAKMSAWLPQIEISNIRVKHLHDNVYRLTLSVRNKGYLATNPQVGVSNKWCPKVKVVLELTKKQTLVSGRSLNFTDILPGSGGTQEFNWLVLGKSGESVKVSAGSPMTGEIMNTITLKK